MFRSKSLFNALWTASPTIRRFIIVLLDLFIIISANSIPALFLNSQKNFYIFENGSSIWIYIFSLVFSLPLYIYTKQYKNLSRYSEAITFYQILARNIILYTLVYYFGRFFDESFPKLPTLLLLALIVGFCQIFFRLFIRDFVNYSRNLTTKKKLKVAIYGAGVNGAQLAKNLKGLNTYKVVCFFDDNPKLWGRSISGILIRNPDEINNFKKDLDQILLAIPNLKGKQRRNIIVKLEHFRIPLLSIPSIEQLVSGQARIDSLKPISIDDLLGRDSVEADKNLLGPRLNGKVILITGAGGSIGSEICRQIYNLNPNKLILFDMNESNLYSINNNLEKLPKKFPIKAVLGNASNYDLVFRTFVDNKVDVVFHAAAYKHVPLVEKNPIEGISNNILSTFNICKAAENSKVKNIVVISSDKAVRPTSIMGATKRLSELIVHAFSQKNQNNFLKDGSLKLMFSMVRFGNVLDSSGSVVPLFKEQIANGGPITLTHEKVMRYFMTIPEASQLVLQSLALAEGGDLFLLDMGEPISIKKLAEQMIALSGQTLKSDINPDGDIEILVTGLRPGEKLYEELLIDHKSLPTIHPLIFKAREKSINQDKLFKKVNSLLKFLYDQDRENTFKTLHELVPEWKQSNAKV